MITKEQIEHVFNIIEYENTYLLFSKQEEGISLKYKFLVAITYETFQIIGHNYRKPVTFDELIKQITDYLSTLRYNSDYYNPMFRKGELENWVIRDHLKKSGFEFIKYERNTTIFRYTASKVRYPGYMHIADNDSTISIRCSIDLNIYISCVEINKDVDIIIPELDKMIEQYFCIIGFESYTTLKHISNTLSDNSVVKQQLLELANSL